MTDDGTERPASKAQPETVLDWLGLREVPDWVKARPLGSLVGALLSFAVPVLFLGATVAAGFVLFKTTADVIHGEEAGPNLGAGALIAALLGAPFVIWGTYIRWRALGFQKEGHITDRISKAVEQLGAEKTVKRELLGDDGKPLLGPDGNPLVAERTVPNIEVRIGGILSLERIAQDSTFYDKGRDHVRVMEILCAYVRENAPAREAKISGRERYDELTANTEDGPGLTGEELANEYGPEFEERVHDPVRLRYWADNLPQPREDIATVLNVIKRRTANQRRVEAGWLQGSLQAVEWVFDSRCPEPPESLSSIAMTEDRLEIYRTELVEWTTKLFRYTGYRIDLSNTNLQRADLSKAVLSGAVLTGARMDGANLLDAQLMCADLRDVFAVGADCRSAKLQGANFTGARMEVAWLGAFLWGSHMTSVQMDGANFRGARMTLADLREVSARDAIFNEARMEGVSFSAITEYGETNLAGATFTGAQMEWADCCGAKMRDTDLSRARMVGADLTHAKMHGAILAGTQMNDAQLNMAVITDAVLDGTNLEGTDLLETAFKGSRLTNSYCRNVKFFPGQLDALFGDPSVTLPRNVTPSHADWPAHWPKWRLPGEFSDDEWRKWRADPTGYVPPPPPHRQS